MIPDLLTMPSYHPHRWVDPVSHAAVLHPHCSGSRLFLTLRDHTSFLSSRQLILLAYPPPYLPGDCGPGSRFAESCHGGPGGAGDSGFGFTVRNFESGMMHGLAMPVDSESRVPFKFVLLGDLDLDFQTQNGL